MADRALPELPEPMPIPGFYEVDARRACRYTAEQMRAYALAAVEAERKRIIAIVMNERVEAEVTKEPSDYAYNMALMHAVDAIRASSKAEGGKRE